MAVSIETVEMIRETRLLVAHYKSRVTWLEALTKRDRKKYWSKMLRRHGTKKFDQLMNKIANAKNEAFQSQMLLEELEKLAAAA